MLKNPPDGYHTLTPQTIVEDAPATIDFLVDVFGAEVKEVYESDGFVQHSELRIGDSQSTAPLPYVSPRTNSTGTGPGESSTARATSGGSRPTSRTCQTTKSDAAWRK